MATGDGSTSKTCTGLTEIDTVKFRMHIEEWWKEGVDGLLGEAVRGVCGREPVLGVKKVLNTQLLSGRPVNLVRHPGYAK